ncbi:hypothetical protein PAMA_013826 [Pampus argenteus]
MVLPPPQRLWVGVLLVLVVVVVELPGGLQKCIFDEVQAQVRVVRAAPVDPDSPPGDTRLAAPTGQQPAHPGLKASPLQAVKQRSILKELAPPTAASPQPIRIRTWIPQEKADSPRRTALRPEGAGLSDTDFLLYLHIQATDKCRAEPNVLAYAVHCQTDTRGRPVAGVVVICRDRLTGATYSHQTTVQDVPPGGVSSHWESRLLQGSIMSAVLGDPITVRIDPVTLAALQDTGWYSVNLSRAQSLVWGDGEGATFGSLSTCLNNSSFFCTGSGLGCHYLHLHKGRCQTDEYLEKCRLYKPLKNGSECWKKENERQSAEEDWSGEIFGSDSRCFFSNLNRQSHSFLSRSSSEGRCYRHRCTGPNRYQIQVSGSEWLDCPAGGSIQIKGYQGSVFCPDGRLCLYADVTPPSDHVNTFPASITSEPYGTLIAAQVTAATSLCFTAAVCLLAAVMVSYRKCCSCRVKIHTVPEDHSYDL